VAQFARFYHTSINDVLDMPHSDFIMYERYIEIIEARERLIAMDCAAYPHTSDRARKESHKKIWKKAFPSELDGRQVLTTDQMMVELSKVNRGK
jgi:hypothetical protein